jgi:branched-chain amino acid transport system substrate-binding protein
MSKHNELPALFLSLLVTAGLIGGGVWLFKDTLFLGNGGKGGLTLPGLPSRSQPALSTRLSWGQQSLTPGISTADRQRGIEAMAANNYAAAIAAFEASLASRRNDPESLIYLNNARIGSGLAHTIAVSVPIANATNIALEILRGVAHAQNQINQAGGINGIPLKVTIASDDNDPEVAKAIAQALVNDAEILGVIGHYSSSTTLAAATVYETGQLVMLSPTSTAVALSDAGDYIFRTVPSDRLAANTLADYMLNQKQYQRVAVFYSAASTYSQSIKSEFTTAVLTDGGEVVAEFDLSQSSFNANQAVQLSQQQGAEVLMLAADVDSQNQSLQVIAANQRQLPLMGGDDLYSPQILQLGGDNTLEMVVSVPWHVLSHLDSPFTETSRMLWGGDVSWRTAMAYDATQSLIAALGQASTRQGIQQALSTAGFQVTGATSEVKFFPSGDRNQPAQLVKIAVGQRSGYGHDYVPVE